MLSRNRHLLDVEPVFWGWLALLLVLTVHQVQRTSLWQAIGAVALFATLPSVGLHVMRSVTLVVDAPLY